MDDNDSNPNYLSCHDSGSLNEERQNNDDIKAWDSANEYLFSALRVTITGAARSVLLKFEQKNGRPGDGRHAWLALKNKYQNTSRKCKRTLLILRLLDNSVMRSDVDLDVFLSDVLQLRDELNDLGNVVSNEQFNWTTACSHMPERDGKDQGEDSPKQTGSCWFARPC